jgi:hypothetical protein
METKVIRWMNREETERLLEKMRAPVKRDAQPVAKPAVVVLQGEPVREVTASHCYKVESL